VSDLFGVKGRRLLKEKIVELPPETGAVTRTLLEQVEVLDQRIAKLEKRMEEVLAPSPEVELLVTLPGVGFILATVIALEVGDVQQFPGPEHLASYAGMVPRVQQSGGKVRYGKTREDVNRYLKRAYSEAANAIARYHPKYAFRHMGQLYARIREKKSHQKAIGAVESTSWKPPGGCSTLDDPIRIWPFAGLGG